MNKMKKKANKLSFFVGEKKEIEDLWRIYKVEGGVIKIGKVENYGKNDIIVTFIDGLNYNTL